MHEFPLIEQSLASGATLEYHRFQVDDGGAVEEYESTYLDNKYFDEFDPLTVEVGHAITLDILALETIAESGSSEWLQDVRYRILGFKEVIDDLHSSA